MEEKRNFQKPGRGGFSQRRNFYGQMKGFNTKNYGGHTWTFYEKEQWEKFQDWLKIEKEREKKESTIDILKGVEEIMEKRLGKRKGRKKEQKRVQEEYSTSGSEASDSEEEEPPKIEKPPHRNRSPKRKAKKEWKKKNDEKNSENLPMKEILESLGRIENKIRNVENRNLNLEIEMEELKREKRAWEHKKITNEVVDMDSEAEKIQEMIRRDDEELKNNDRWREIQSEYKGKDGTTKLKEWCLQNEIPYKNKDNAMMAVLATDER